MWQKQENHKGGEPVTYSAGPPHYSASSHAFTKKGERRRRVEKGNNTNGYQQQRCGPHGASYAFTKEKKRKRRKVEKKKTTKMRSQSRRVQATHQKSFKTTPTLPSQREKKRRQRKEG